jgi:hypothetical protein
MKPEGKKFPSALHIYSSTMDALAPFYDRWQRRSSAADYCIANVHVLEADAAGTHGPCDVHIHGTKIASIVASRGVERPPGAAVIDGRVVNAAREQLEVGPAISESAQQMIVGCVGEIATGKNL